MHYVLPLVLILLSNFLSIGDADRAQDLVDAALEEHGSELLVHAEVEFTFRGHQYTVNRDGWRYVSVRRFIDDQGNQFEDTHNKKGIFRKVNGQAVELDQRTKGAIETAMNSVVYFAYLPLKLNDPAVRKTYMGTGNIDGKTLEKVKVTFDQEGGGKDFEDVFMFWFDPNSKRMTHLAYFFHVNGGGARFREAVNTRRVGGVLFSDYTNYSADLGSDLEKFESPEYRQASMLLSTIDLEKVKLKRLN